MRIPNSAFTEIVQSSRLAYPYEACGLLSGPPGGPGPTRNQQMENVVEHPRYRYAMDPDCQIAAWKAIEAVGHRVWAIWHSHTTGGAEPSREDLRHALDPDVWHLIVGLPRADGPTEVRLWRIVEGRSVEQDFEVSV